MTNDRLARGIARLDAVELPDGRYAYRADETQTFWLVDESDVEALADALDDDSDGTAYSRWCADTDAEEMPQGWTPS